MIEHFEAARRRRLRDAGTRISLLWTCQLNDFHWINSRLVQFHNARLSRSTVSFNPRLNWALLRASTGSFYFAAFI